MSANPATSISKTPSPPHDQTSSSFEKKMSEEQEKSALKMKMTSKKKRKAAREIKEKRQQWITCFKEGQLVMETFLHKIAYKMLPVFNLWMILTIFLSSFLCILQTPLNHFDAAFGSPKPVCETQRGMIYLWTRVLFISGVAKIIGQA